MAAATNWRIGGTGDFNGFCPHSEVRGGVHTDNCIDLYFFYVIRLKTINWREI